MEQKSLFNTMQEQHNMKKENLDTDPKCFENICKMQNPKTPKIQEKLSKIPMVFQEKNKINFIKITIFPL